MMPGSPAGKAAAELARRIRAPCRCDHGEAMHDIRRNGSRGRCSVLMGPRGDPCPCRVFTPQDQLAPGRDAAGSEPAAST